MNERNRLIKVTLEPIDMRVNGECDRWRVCVTKAFAPEHGSGTQDFVEYSSGPFLHPAVDLAKQMITATPGQRE